MMMQLATAVALVAGGVLLTASVAAADPAALRSGHTFLAIDDSVFEQLSGLSLETCEAERYAGNPVLTNRPDDVDSGRAGFSGAVALEGGTFRLWYMAYDGKSYRTCYAESADGRTWTRPALGLFEYKGSKDNNIVYNDMAVLVPFYDADETDPQKRYKSTVYGHITEQYFVTDEQKKRYGKGQPGVKGIAYSPDGIRWTLDTSNPFPIPAKMENAVLYRLHGRYFIVCQMNVGEYPQVDRYSRFLGVAVSDDLKTWKLADKPGFFFDPRFNGLIQTHVAPAYQNHGNVVVGAQGLFMNHPELSSQQADLITILTNDGLTWRQPATRQPLSYLLRRGPAGAWDHHFNVQVGLINAGRETLLYYAGKPDNGNLPTGGHQLGLATLRLDGYGYLAPAVGWNYANQTFEAHTLSKPIEVTGQGLNLYLNTTGAREGDELKVELQDEQGTPLPGFTLAECDNITTGGVGVPVTWNGTAALDGLASRTVRVKIHWQAQNPTRSINVRSGMARLYAFYFDRPAVWFNAPQRVLSGRGIERLNYNDPLPQKVVGLNLATDAPTDVTARRLEDGGIAMSFSSAASVTVSWDKGQACTVGGKSVPFANGAAAFKVQADQEVVVKPAP